MSNRTTQPVTVRLKLIRGYSLEVDCQASSETLGVKPGEHTIERPKYETIISPHEAGIPRVRTNDQRLALSYTSYAD